MIQIKNILTTPTTELGLENTETDSWTAGYMGYYRFI